MLIKTKPDIFTIRLGIYNFKGFFMKKTIFKLVLVSLGFIGLTLLYAFIGFSYNEKYDPFNMPYYLIRLISILLARLDGFVPALIATVYTLMLYLAVAERKRRFLAMILNTVVVMAVTIPLAVILMENDILWIEGLGYTNTMFLSGLISILLTLMIKLVNIIHQKRAVNRGGNG